VVPLGVGLWAFAGPLQPGWARTRGATGTASTSLVSEPESTGFTAAVSGTRTTDASGGGGIVISTIRGPVAGALGLNFDLELTGRALDEGVELRSGTLAFGPPADASRWSGRVSQLDGGHVVARVADASNRGLVVDLQLQIDRADNTVTGTISARASSAGSPSDGE
jgi:hypothetical protein